MACMTAVYSGTAVAWEGLGCDASVVLLGLSQVEELLALCQNFFESLNGLMHLVYMSRGFACGTLSHSDF